MKAGISGYQVEGTWVQVVDHGERLSRVLHELGALAHPRMGSADYQEALDEWDVWRPGQTDALEDAVRQRTAEQASLGPSPGERRGRTALEDLQDAGRALVEGPDRIPDGAATAWSARLVEAARLASRAADTGLRNLLRTAEEGVYVHVMTRLSPYYFDNRLVSANIDRLAGEQDTYRFEVDVNNDELKEQVTQALDAADSPASAE